jgi:hypothetical protein
MVYKSLNINHVISRIKGLVLTSPNQTFESHGLDIVHMWTDIHKYTQNLGPFHYDLIQFIWSVFIGRPSETSATIYQTRPHIPEHRNLNIHRCRNLGSQRAEIPHVLTAGIVKILALGYDRRFERIFYRHLQDASSTTLKMEAVISSKASVTIY